MKKFNAFKIIQLSIIILLTILSLALLLQPDIKQYVFSSQPATILFIVIWVILLANFIFLLIDFSLIASMKLDYHNLYEVAYSDLSSGIPNRFSCDTIIEKYYDQPLPENVGCVMIDFTNLYQINSSYDRKTGNQMLKEFSNILSLAAVSLCFVGRNGGNKFLAIFENCSDERIHTFLARIHNGVEKHNLETDAIRLEYAAGTASNEHEHLEQITQLISLANSRISEPDVSERG